MPNWKDKKYRRGRQGQVLILAVLAIIILAVAIMILFDIQRIMRGKIRAMSAVDAAALTGAEWQKHTLNLVGELNLVKACQVLISDSIYGIGGNPNNFMKVDVTRDSTEAEIAAAIAKARQELEQLKKAAAILTEMQVRVSFAGPLIGFGAAQQAAKNNGLPYNKNCNEYMIDFYNLIMDDDVYGNPDIAPQIFYNYSWRFPYANMIFALTGSLDPDSARGVAVGTMVRHLGMPHLYADPPTNPNFIAYLQLKMVMEAIAANDWCILKALVDADDASYFGKWWGNIKIEPNKKFLGCSEILPIHANYTEGQQILTYAEEDGYIAYAIKRKRGRENLIVPLTQYYNQTDPVNANGSINWNDADMKFNPLPSITWAVFDGRWQSYENAGINVNNDWNQYLRSGFRPGFDYFSGALSYFSVTVPNQAIIRRHDLPAGLLKAGGNSESDGWKKMSHYSSKASASQRNMDLHGIRAYSTAKPFGNLKDSAGNVHYPFAASMILPVFDKTALVPVALEYPDGLEMEDRAWIIYLTKFLPALGTVNSLDEVKNVMKPEHYNIVDQAGYIGLIRKLQDPEWRRAGREWLDAEATGHDEPPPNGIGESIHVIDTRNRDHCFDWLKSGSGGHRYGPSVLF